MDGKPLKGARRGSIGAVDAVDERAVPMFQIKTVEQWMREARRKPRPGKLFDDLWHEGEIALMFGESGAGKSILAMQIAESIAGGGAIPPFDAASGPQNVLYVDLSMTDKQLEMRYTADEETPTEGRQTSAARHKFPKQVFRAEFNPLGAMPEGGTRIEDAVYQFLRKAVVKTSAKAVIIDDLTFFKRGNGHVESMVAMMRRLRMLKAEFNVSILVLVEARGRSYVRAAGRALTLDDLGAAQVLNRLADSVFAIGQSRTEAGLRYLKQLARRNGKIRYSAARVPGFCIEMRDGNFLSFGFDDFHSESHHLAHHDCPNWLGRARAVQQYVIDGMTQREIAEKMGISLGSVNRYARVRLTREWRPKRPQPPADENGGSAEMLPDEDYPGEETDRMLVSMGFRAAHPPDLYDDAPDESGAEADAGSDRGADTLPKNILPPDATLRPPFNTLPRFVTKFGKHIYVEKFDERGKPTIWLTQEPKDKIRRWRRKLFGIAGEAYETEPRELEDPNENLTADGHG